MARSSELREFLATRRARITPHEAGLPTLGHRRVPSLRREEVATLTGVSSEYYTRLERGDANGVSDSVLESLAQALQLDDAERAHLYNLVRASTPAARATRRPSAARVRPTVQRLLDRMPDAPAFVQNGRLDMLAANTLAQALYRDLYDSASIDGTRIPNHGRFVFLDPRAVDLYPHWQVGRPILDAGARQQIVAADLRVTRCVVVAARLALADSVLRCASAQVAAEISGRGVMGAPESC